MSTATRGGRFFRKAGLGAGMLALALLCAAMFNSLGAQNAEEAIFAKSSGEVTKWLESPAVVRRNRLRSGFMAGFLVLSVGGGVMLLMAAVGLYRDRNLETAA